MIAGGLTGRTWKTENRIVIQKSQWESEISDANGGFLQINSNLSIAVLSGNRHYIALLHNRLYRIRVHDGDGLHGEIVNAGFRGVLHYRCDSIIHALG
jgi:hypothetical protein